MLYYIRHRRDAYIESRLKDVIGWGLQCHNQFDSEIRLRIKGMDVRALLPLRGATPKRIFGWLVYANYLVCANAVGRFEYIRRAYRGDCSGGIPGKNRHTMNQIYSINCITQAATELPGLLCFCSVFIGRAVII